MKLDGIKSEHMKNIDFLEMKTSDITSTKPPSYKEQTTVDTIALPLLKSTEKYSHASQFTKKFHPLKIEGGTLLQIKKWWDAIKSAF